jgi:riboflavin kinase/FMN adenylyltransferase
MRILSEASELPGQELTMAIGTFDGVHVGHATIIRKLRQLAEPGADVALTFDRHPKEVVSPDSSPELLTLPDEKIHLIEGLGVSNLLVVPFDQRVSNLSAGEFLSEFADGRLGTLVVGFNFKLGRGGRTGTKELRALSTERGFVLRVEGPVEIRGSPVSSTRIRTELKRGGVAAAAEMLGRPYELSGEVRSGDARGRTLGFPTANLRVWPRKLLPGDGVYACLSTIGPAKYPALASIGPRPTFGDSSRTIEVYAVGFDGSIYGEAVSIGFLERIRDIRIFESPDALRRQIEQDLEMARELFDLQGSGR